MKTVPRNVQVVAHDELAELGDLPEALSVALADIAGVAKEVVKDQRSGRQVPLLAVEAMALALRTG